MTPPITRMIPAQRSPGTASFRIMTLKIAANRYSSAVSGSATVTSDQERAARKRT